MPIDRLPEMTLPGGAPVGIGRSSNDCPTVEREIHVDVVAQRHLSRRIDADEVALIDVRPVAEYGNPDAVVARNDVALRGKCAPDRGTRRSRLQLPRPRFRPLRRRAGRIRCRQATIQRICRHPGATLMPKPLMTRPRTVMPTPSAMMSEPVLVARVFTVELDQQHGVVARDAACSGSLPAGCSRR